MHNHKHNCSCDHDRVKYCKCCGVVYCLDCNMEWKKGFTWAYTYGTTGTYYKDPGYIYCNSGAGVNDSQLTTTSCKHGAQ